MSERMGKGNVWKQGRRECDPWAGHTGRAGGHHALRQSPERVYGSLSSVWPRVIHTAPKCVSKWMQREDTWVSWPVQHPVVVLGMHLQEGRAVDVSI